MRLIAVAGFAAMLATAAHADTMANCASAWKAMSAADKGSMTYKAWSTKCLAKGFTAPTPTAAAPTGATALCKDGSYSLSKTASGRCSSHGGVNKAL